MRARSRRVRGLDPHERGVDVLDKLRLEWAGHTRTIVANSLNSHINLLAYPVRLRARKYQLGEASRIFEIA